MTKSNGSGTAFWHLITLYDNSFMLTVFRFGNRSLYSFTPQSLQSQYSNIEVLELLLQLVIVYLDIRTTEGE